MLNNRALGVGAAAVAGALAVFLGSRKQSGEEAGDRPVTLKMTKSNNNIKYLSEAPTAGNTNPFAKTVDEWDGVIQQQQRRRSNREEWYGKESQKVATTTSFQHDKDQTADTEKSPKKSEEDDLRGTAEVEIEDDDDDTDTTSSSDQKSMKLNFTVNLSDLFFQAGEEMLKKLEKGDERVRELLQAAAESDSIDVGVVFHFQKKPTVDRLISDDDDEEGEATDVSTLHYCHICKENIVVDGKSHYCPTCEEKAKLN